jgi:hypothetical protein
MSQTNQPIVIPLIDKEGFSLRTQAAEYINNHLNRKGAERGSIEEQGFGALAEIVIRKQLGFPLINSIDHPLAYDILLPSGIKVDVKCRGGIKPFQTEYLGKDGYAREAKHNFFARQVFDEKLDTDIYLMTHLLRPSNPELPGSTRQRKWILYICGWVSKQRVKNEGVYLPRGSFTEQGDTWFPYRGQEIEFYHSNLNYLETIEQLLTINPDDVNKDAQINSSLHLTTVDLLRISQDLVGQGLISPEVINWLKTRFHFDKPVKPFLHTNQYLHACKWLHQQGHLSDVDLHKIEQVMSIEQFEGI